jgi:hypothetical protein
MPMAGQPVEGLDSPEPERQVSRAGGAESDSDEVGTRSELLAKVGTQAVEPHRGRFP